MKWISLIVVAIIVLCCELSCDKGQTIVETSMLVIGTVTDSLSGSALDSVGIATSDTDSAVVRSDSTGAYRFVSWGKSCTLYAVKDGYTTKWQLAHDGDTIDFQLVPD